MKMLKNNTYLSLILLLPLVLTGCKWGKKRDVSESRKCKKVALQDTHHGLPIVRDGQKSVKSQRVKNVSAFVVKDNDDELLVSPTLVASDENISHSDSGWRREKSAEKEFEPVLFGFDSAEIRAKEQTKLAYDIDRAQQAVRDGYTIVVEGHADSKYISAEYNIAKSEERANVGKKELLKNGIPEEQIKVVAYGDHKRAVNVAGKDERNRRIEFVKVSHGDDNVITL
jgi:outer membrane protein OmpA-like peptidoglycan-associated protein